MENFEKQTKRIFTDEMGDKIEIKSYADSDMGFEALNRKYVYLNMEQLKELRNFINNHIAIHESMKMVNGVKFSFPLHTPEIGDVFSSSIPAVIQRKEYDELRMKSEDFDAMRKDRDQLLEKVENLENIVESLSNRSESWQKATSKLYTTDEDLVRRVLVTFNNKVLPKGD
jgi:hypothetical protein